MKKLILILVTFYCFPWVVFPQSLKKFKERYRVAPDKTFRIKLNVDAGEIEIVKSPRPYEMRIKASYRKGMYDLDVDFDKDRSKIYIDLDRRKWMESSDRDDSHLTIELPPEVEIDFESRIKAGEVDMDFGGLTLKEIQTTTWAGEVIIDFSEPNFTEMDYLYINTKIGETTITHLGNARFKEAEINGGIGALKIDFTGDLLSRADVEIDLDIGETEILLTEDVAVKLRISKFLFLSNVQISGNLHKRGRYYYSENYESASKKLFLKIRPGLGELMISQE